MEYAVCAAFVLMTGFYLAFQHMKRLPGHSRTLQIILKCTATAMAVLVALLGCLKNGIAAHWVLLAGLVACTIADGVLCVRFMIGGGIFALGHILYMIAFGLMNKPGWPSLLLFVALMGAATAAFTRFRDRIGRRYPLFYTYAAILCIMVSMAAAQPPLFFAGAVLFALSDALLGYLGIDRNHVQLDYISLGAYYLAQFLLALAVFIG